MCECERDKDVKVWFCFRFGVSKGFELVNTRLL